MSDTGQTDALAAEYVLGTLDSDERTQAHALLEIDQEFVAKVASWERRLGELHLMVEPVEPDAKVWARIKARMPEVQPRAEPRLPQAPQIPESSADLAPAETEPAEAATKPADASAAASSTPPPVAAPSPSPTPAPLASFSASPLTGPALGPPASPVPSSEPSPPPSLPPSPVTGPPAPPSTSPTATPIPSPTSPSAAPPLRAAAEPPPIPAMQIPAVERDDKAALRVRRRLRRWRAFATLLVLVVAAAAGLVAAWKFVPERVPPALHPAELMRLVGVTVDGRPLRRPAPPESQFDE